MSAGEPAELIVIDELRPRRGVAADDTVRVAADAHDAELHGKGIEQEQAAAERLTSAQDQLDSLDGLNAADNAGQGAQDPGVGARGHHSRRRWRRVEAAVAALAGQEDRGLTVEEEDAAVHQRFLEEDGGVVRRVAGWTVVTPVHHD